MSSRPRWTMRLRSLALLAVFLGAIVSLQATSLAPTAHAASCFQGSCEGEDPQGKGCDVDAQNVDSFTYQGGDAGLSGTLLELRYSPTCDAGWVRSTGGNCMPSSCGVAIETSRGDPNNIDHYMLASSESGGGWSNMVNYRFFVRGCFVAYSLGAPNGYTRDECTGWH